MVKNKRKILILSSEVWREESNGGNVLSNLFGPLTDEYDFAQIYCSPQLPNNKICSKYFHLSEEDMIGSCIKKKCFGHELLEEDLLESQVNKDVKESTLFSLIKNSHFAINYTFQDFLWRNSKWKTPELKKFILDFNPDIIFAPMYYGLHIHRLDRYVFELTGKKVVSYVSDDHLTLKQFSLSPIFWFNRLLLRKNVISTAKYYSLLYTMTQEQLDEYQPMLKVPMKILKKAANFENTPYIPEKSNNPLKVVYGGNLTCNRYKTLNKIVKALREINEKSVIAQLYIYTQTPITYKLKNLLHDGKNSFLMGKVSMNVLNKKYSEADVTLHVESFELKQRLLTKLSFSTKIIDLLHSARCIVAICWDKSSPYIYLESQDAAICISNPADIKTKLLQLIDHPDIMKEYAQKAWRCGKRNHNAKEVFIDLKKDFDKLI